MAETPDLTKLAQQAEAQAALLAGRVASYARARQFSDVALAAHLGCSPAALNTLKLCRVPLNDNDFILIVLHTGCNADRLRGLLDATEPATLDTSA